MRSSCSRWRRSTQRSAARWRARFQASPVLADDAPHRYVIFLDGVNTESTANYSTKWRFFGIEMNLRLNPPPGRWADFVYFSYAAAARKQAGGRFCEGWANGCASGSADRLASLTLDPIYATDDTKISVDAQIQALDWLLFEILATDSLAQIDIVGFSLGGIVATRWAATLSAPSAHLDHVHAIVLLDSPVGGIPIANAVVDGCDFDPNPVNVILCGVWNYSLIFFFGTTLLYELQHATNGQSRPGSIVPSLRTPATHLT